MILEDYSELGYGINIYNEDFRKVMKLLDDESVDMAVTDPPYRITSRGNAGTTGGFLTTDIALSGKIFKHNDVKIIDYAKEYFRVLKDGSHCYIMTNHINLIEMLNTFTGVGFHFIKSLIWDKGNKIMGKMYMSQFEYILFFRKGKGVQINNCGDSDIIAIPNIKTKDGGENIHDTEKPVKLMEYLILNSSKEGDLVLDSFLGSGSTALACMNTGRLCVGSEIDEKYFKVIKNRIEERIDKVNNQLF